jgi:hypothetical protein
MITTKRVLAVSAAVAATGGAVVGLPEPAGAHDTPNIFLGRSSAGVGADHWGVQACNRDRGYTAQVRYHTELSADEYILGNPNYGTCAAELAPSRVTRFRLCLYPGGGCTGWKTA